MKGLMSIIALTGIGIVLALFSLSMHAAESGVTPSALTCDDFVPTEAALARFPDLAGACETVVERNGELYGQFRAVVRRASFSSVTLYLPVTDHTFRVKPEGDARVLLGGVKVRPRDLRRGQEIRIYLSTAAFSTPNVEEVSLVTESDLIISHKVESVAALPTTG